MKKYKAPKKEGLGNFDGYQDRIELSRDEQAKLLKILGTNKPLASFDSSCNTSKPPTK